MYSPQWRDDDETIVDDEDVIRLACWASGVYDQDQWYTGQVPDDVWDVVNAGRTEEVTAAIEAGASWTEALNLVGSIR
jgi:hypothetical protein